MVKYKHQEMNAYLIWTARDEFGCVTDIVKEMMDTWNAEGDCDPFMWEDADDRDLVTYRLAKACEADAYILTDSMEELVKACREAKKKYTQDHKSYLNLIREKLIRNGGRSERI